jgi:tripeptidyl-peptidase-1
VNKDEEVAVSRFPSGGGFSNIYAQPRYQNDALTAYFSTHDPGYKYYNASETNNLPESVTAGGLCNRGG